MSENIARTPREGLDQLIAEIGTLRNAGTRSPSFRAWRQATLTLIQRIWPGDPAGSERFCRIPFSPNHTRADSTELRNIYEKGCAEASTYLRELRDRIGDQGWAEVERSAYSEAFEVGSTEDDFPTLDLPPGNGPRPAAKSKSRARAAKTAPARNASLGDLLKEAESKATRSGAPALPLAESRIIPSDHEAAPAPARSRGRRASPGTKKVKDRLKDMLGFGEAATPAAPAVTPAPNAPAESVTVSSPPVVAPAPVAIPPIPISTLVAATTPAPVAAIPPPPPVAPPAVIAPIAPIAPPTSAPGVPSDLLRELETPAPPVAMTPPAPTLNDMLMTADFTARLEASIDPNEWVSPIVPGPEELAEGLPPEPSIPPVAAPPAASPAAMPTPPTFDSASVRPMMPPSKRADVFTAMDAFGPPLPPALAPPPAIAPPPASTSDEHDFGRVTEEFLRNSPVLSSMGSPVRRKETPEPKAGYLVPEAVEILGIAGRTGEFGVPEGRRAHARAYLAELARGIENRDLSWDTLRDSVQFLMEFPPLARRVLPLLLPFLDQAA